MEASWSFGWWWRFANLDLLKQVKWPILYILCMIYNLQVWWWTMVYWQCGISNGTSFHDPVTPRIPKYLGYVHLHCLTFFASNEFIHQPPVHFECAQNNTCVDILHNSCHEISGLSKKIWNGYKSMHGIISQVEPSIISFHIWYSRTSTTSLTAYLVLQAVSESGN